MPTLRMMIRILERILGGTAGRSGGSGDELVDGPFDRELRLRPGIPDVFHPCAGTDTKIVSSGRAAQFPMEKSVS